MNANDIMELTGKFSSAKVFTTEINEETVAQIQRLLDHPFSEGSKIRIMPDAHIGKGAVVGTSMTFQDKIVPDVVGVDIGCGMYTADLGKIKLKEKDLQQLDNLIQRRVPSGTETRRQQHPFLQKLDLDKIHASLRRRRRSELSLGSLGSGNHFIELNQDENENVYLVIHSGSRSLGHDIASYHQKKAVNLWKEKGNVNEAGHPVDTEFAYLTDQDMEEYLQDVAIAQRYAYLNRKAMVQEIAKGMNWEIVRTFDTVHNYVDLSKRIIRKGAISAQEGEEILIPFNMRDGSVIAVGKGNPDWNDSAPHGAGRLLSRTQARKQLKMKEFTEVMTGIYTTSVKKGTLDEAPFAYKSMEEILSRTSEAFTVKAVLRPLYNFKA